MVLVARFVAALVAVFALYSLRAWFVLGGAFFGVVPGAYGLGRAGDWPPAAFMVVMGGWILVNSYRWFAVRWWPERQSGPRAV